MFTQQKKNLFAKLLGLTLNELEEFIHRYRGHLNSRLEKESLSFNQVMYGLIYFEDIKNKQSAKGSVEHIKYGSIRSEEIRKYGAEILDLNKDGYGAKRLCNAMKSLHNIAISKSTMDRFLRLNQEGD